MKTLSLLGLSSLLACLAALTPACSGQVALEDRPCPCASGWTCCPSRNVCVAPGTACGETPPPNGTTPSPEAGGPPAASANPIELAGAQSARCMVAAGDHVYWQNADGLVVGAERAGGRVEISHFRTPLANNPSCGIAVEGERLFTTSYALGKILELSLRSNGDWVVGAAGTLFGQVTTPSSLALDADAVYVTELDAGNVTRVPRTRQASTVLAAGLTRPHGIVATTDDVFFVERGDSGAGNGAIKRVPKTGGATVEIATGQADPAGLAIVDGTVYWTAGGKVWSVAATGGAPREVAREVTPVGLGVVSDAKSLYYAARASLTTVPLAGGEPRELYKGLPIAMAVDEGRVFWSDGSRVFSGTK